MPPRPLPQIAGVVRAAVSGLTPSNQKWVNVHHLQYAAGASAPGSTEIAAVDALLARLYTGTTFGAGVPWLSVVANNWTLQQIDYTVLDGTSMGYTYAHAATGSVAGATLPPECSPVLTLLTGRRGRRYRGRIFLPAPTGAILLTAGTITGTAITNIQTQYTGMISAMSAIQWLPVVASYGHGSYLGSPTTWTPFATAVTAVRMDPYVDVQRRRKN